MRLCFRNVLASYVLFFAAACCTPPVFAAAPNTLTPEEIGEGWILLFDGETTFGWRPTSNANWQVANGVISVSEGEKGFLKTTSEFADYTLKVDFRSGPQTNSGVFLHLPKEGSNPASDCYELNVAPPALSPFATGSFVNRLATSGDHLRPGEWQTFEVSNSGGHWSVSVDGKQALHYTDPQPLPRGYIGLQLNSGPVEFRNVKLKPLALQSIFNGKDLTGWKEYPGKASKFSVTPEGWINVQNGNGQLESEGRYADFILQLDVFSAGAGLNSGIFFRSIPGDFWMGYESQVNNAFKDGDRTKPADFGTGAIYRRQPRRKVVSDDFQWFTKTILANGPHMAVWVNGYLVTDWTDERASNANPREGLRLEAGTFIIQGHDPTTNLSFRNIRVGEMGKRAQ